MGCHRLEAAADTHPEAAAAAAWLPAAAVDSLVACRNLAAAFHTEGSLVGRHSLVEAVAACRAAEGILAAACRTLLAAAADTLAVAHTDTLAAAFPVARRHRRHRTYRWWQRGCTCGRLHPLVVCHDALDQALGQRLGDVQGLLRRRVER